MYIMKKNFKKILSATLLLVYLMSTLGFVVSEKNCICCKSEAKCGLENVSDKICCSEKPELPSCCANKEPIEINQQNNCQCEKYNCDKSEYVKISQMIISAKTEVFISKIKNIFSETISELSDNNKTDFLKNIKFNPPPILIKDSEFIIEISKIKIPA